jgi:hypothetical protein
MVDLLNKQNISIDPQYTVNKYIFEDSGFF